ncbi:DUF5988 family protein [Streptomyces sp. NPDC007076]|uniref:DUF5988 family protein n=1 Tax=unclassified Streptomyces TaxID=2593676 RepID=UPI002E790C34|nr:DUF5988 family protein [Streptomyces sp. JV190]MEE1840598.1 DUF5988 family protein [Streptomyces sp. JV190]
MTDASRAVLEGGPDDLPERIVPLTAPGPDIKVPFRGGYEHFRATARHRETAEGKLPVYEWWERTEVPG